MIKNILLKNLVETILKENQVTDAPIQTKDQSLADFYNSEVKQDVSEAGIGGISHPADYAKLASDPSVKKVGDAGEPGEGPLVHMKKPKIVDENGNVYSEQELISLIKQRPAKLIGQNTKMKKSGVEGETWVFYDITLPAYRGLYVDEAKNELRVVTTCPMAGACKKFCYARKGGFIQFPNSSLNSSRIINFLMNDWNGFKHQLQSEIKSAFTTLQKKGKKLIIRWHDAGDFFSPEYLDLAFDVARSLPDVTFYAYTKQVNMVKKANKPENFTFNLSVGGLEDADIDPKTNKHSQVVPNTVFKDLLVPEDPSDPKNKGKKPRDDSDLQQMKDNLAKHYNLDVSTVVSYDELYKIPYKPADGPKWNVMVWAGHGDTAAVRKDVLGTYLFIH